MLIEKIIHLVADKQIVEANPFAKNTGIGYASNPQSGSPASPSGNRSLRQQQLRSFNTATNAPATTPKTALANQVPGDRQTAPRTGGANIPTPARKTNATSTSSLVMSKVDPSKTLDQRMSELDKNLAALKRGEVTLGRGPTGKFQFQTVKQAAPTPGPAQRPATTPAAPKTALANQIPGSRQTAPKTGGGGISSKQAAPTKSSYDPSPLTSFARGAADSATFGAAKYARAAAETGVKKLLGRDTSFQKELDQEQEKQNIAQAKNPLSYKAGEYAPLVAGGAGVAKGLAKGAGAVVRNAMRKGPELKDYYPPKALSAPTSATQPRALPAPPTTPTLSSPPTTPKLPAPSSQPPAPKSARLGKVDGDKQTMYYNGRQVPFSKLRIVDGQIRRAN